MLITPSPLTSGTLDKEVLKSDLKQARRFGPCAVGKKALYLNSFYLSRRYYVPYKNIVRVFKRVAMSAGGFTGKGIFATIPYLVVTFRDGSEKQCNFKVEAEVDALIAELQNTHPELKFHSKKAEDMMREAEEEEKKRYIKNLPADAAAEVKRLTADKEFLEGCYSETSNLTYTAREMRRVSQIPTSSRVIAFIVLALGILVTGAGLYMRIGMNNTMGIYLAMFGVMLIYFAAITGYIPTRRNNAEVTTRAWYDAIRTLDDLTSGRKDYDVPPQYSHPIVLERMIRVIREGRADNSPDALDLVMEDLKALNSSVEVSQAEHDEVVAVKPLFLAAEYKKEIL